MGRGLSQQQNDILAALPWFTDDIKCGEAPTRIELVDLLGLEFTESTRVSVTRAVSRLQRRGLILNIWGFHRGYQREGYARATPEQIENRQANLQAFLSRSNQP
jgi:hypothetical protein